MAENAQTLQSLLDISNLVGSVLELDTILEEVCRIGSRTMDANVCSVYLLDESNERLVLRASNGLNPEVIGKASLPVGVGISGWCVKHNEPVALEDCRQDPRFRPIEGSGEEVFMGYLCNPLRIQEEVIGVMTARMDHPHQWSIEEMTLFETICKLVAVVIEKSRLYYKTVESERLAAIGLSLSEIAHYIKNLLQGMSGGQYFVESGLKRGDIERSRQGWEMLDRNLRKISSLVENMLNFSRVSTPHFEHENLNGLLYEIARSVEETAVRRSINLKIILDDTIPEIPMAYDALHEAFFNLLTNAVDAIPEGQPGTVTIQSRLDLAAYVARVSISDTGIGIPPENHERVFKLFFSTKGRRGTGIGLAVTRKIIEEHHARIFLESEVGKGSTFIVELPLDHKS
jgi:signal transduction histidine kinase